MQIQLLIYEHIVGYCYKWLIYISIRTSTSTLTSWLSVAD